MLTDLKPARKRRKIFAICSKHNFITDSQTKAPDRVPLKACPNFRHRLKYEHERGTDESSQGQKFKRLCTCWVFLSCVCTSVCVTAKQVNASSWVVTSVYSSSGSPLEGSEPSLSPLTPDPPHRPGSRCSPRRPAQIASLFNQRLNSLRLSPFKWSHPVGI